MTIGAPQTEARLTGKPKNKARFRLKQTQYLLCHMQIPSFLGSVAKIIIMNNSGVIGSRWGIFMLRPNQISLPAKKARVGGGLGGRVVPMTIVIRRGFPFGNPKFRKSTRLLTNFLPSALWFWTDILCLDCSNLWQSLS